jgi:hypothetical protein
MCSSQTQTLQALRTAKTIHTHTHTHTHTRTHTRTHTHTHTHTRTRAARAHTHTMKHHLQAPAVLYAPYPLLDHHRGCCFLIATSSRRCSGCCSRFARHGCPTTVCVTRGAGLHIFPAFPKGSPSPPLFPGRLPALVANWLRFAPSLGRGFVGMGPLCQPPFGPSLLAPAPTVPGRLVTINSTR